MINKICILSVIFFLTAQSAESKKNTTNKDIELKPLGRSKKIADLKKHKSRCNDKKKKLVQAWCALSALDGNSKELDYDVVRACVRLDCYILCDELDIRDLERDKKNEQ